MTGRGVKQFPKLTLVGREAEEHQGDLTASQEGTGTSRAGSTFELVGLDSLDPSEKERLQSGVQEILPRAAILGVARTPRRWDLRPVVAFGGEESPSIVRFVGPAIFSNSHLAARIRETYDRLKSQTDLHSGVLSCGTLRGEFWYRRPLAETTLAHVLSSPQNLSELQVFSIAHRLVEELSRWHGRGIVHAHITSSNIWVASQGRAFLFDPCIGFSTIQATKGKTDYNLQSFAPELLSGETAAFSSDIYGLGLVFRRLFLGLAKRAPYENNRERMEKQVRPFLELSEAMLHENPNERPGLAQLRRFVTDAFNAVDKQSKDEQKSKNQSASHKQGKIVRPAASESTVGRETVEVKPKAGSADASVTSEPASVQARAVESASPAAPIHAAPEPAPAPVAPPQTSQPAAQAVAPAVSHVVSPAFGPVGAPEMPSQQPIIANQPYIQPTSPVYSYPPPNPYGHAAPIAQPGQHFQQFPPTQPMPYSYPPQGYQPYAGGPAYPGGPVYPAQPMGPQTVQPQAIGPQGIPMGGIPPVYQQPGVAPAAQPKKDSGLLGLGIILFGLLGAFWYYRTHQSSYQTAVYEDAAVEDLSDPARLKEAWTSKIPSRMIPVAEIALGNSDLTKAAQTIIIESAAHGDEGLIGVNVPMLRVAFDGAWESELSTQDRRSAMAMGLVALLKERLPRDLQKIDGLHPGVVLAATASAGKTASRILQGIPATVLTRLVPPYGAAFKELTKDFPNLNCGDDAVQRLARLGTRGAVDGLDDITLFLRTESGAVREDASRRLRALAVMFSYNNGLSNSLLQVLLKHPNLSIDIPSIKWAKDWDLMNWKELEAGDQLFVLAGVPPAGVITPENLGKLFAHPSDSIRAYAIGKALDRIKMGHPGAYDVFRLIQADPSLLTPRQTVELAHLLEKPETLQMATIQSWINSKPPVQIVAPLLLATAGLPKSTSLDTALAIYLKDNSWKPDLSTLRKLSQHPDGYTRMFAYNELYLMEDRETAREFLQAASRKESNPENRTQLQQMLDDLSKN